MLNIPAGINACSLAIIITTANSALLSWKESSEIFIQMIKPSERSFKTGWRPDCYYDDGKYTTIHCLFSRYALEYHIFNEIWYESEKNHAKNIWTYIWISVVCQKQLNWCYYQLFTTWIRISLLRRDAYYRYSFDVSHIFCLLPYAICQTASNLALSGVEVSYTSFPKQIKTGNYT